MPTPTLIPEDGTGMPNANSYASLAEADAYADAHLYAQEWTAADVDRKTVALVMASRVLDSSTDWIGSRSHADQGLAWPRTGAKYDGVLIGQNVPRAVKNATAELARLLMKSDLTEDVAQNNLKSLNLGKGALEIDFKDGSEKKRIPTSVGELLMGLGNISSDGGIVIRRVAR